MLSTRGSTVVYYLGIIVKYFEEEEGEQGRGGSNYKSLTVHLRLLLSVLLKTELKRRRNWLRSLRLNGSFCGMSALTIK